MARRERPLSGAEQLGRLLNPAGPLSGCDADIDFDLVATTAMNWRMGATLFEAARAGNLEARFADDALMRLHGAHLATVMRNRVLRRRVGTVLRALEAAGLAPVVLKGGIRLFATPPGADCTRFMEDVDLLVAPADHDRAEALTRDLGFRPHAEVGADCHHGPKMRDRDTGIEIEIHSRPLSTDRPGFTQGLAAALQEEVTADGLVLRCPAKPYQLLHNMIHALDGHGGYLQGDGDLRQLHDFALGCASLGPGFDWPWFDAAAGTLGLRSHLRAWIFAAHRIFGLPLPHARFRWVERNLAARMCRDHRPGRAVGFIERAVHVHALAAAGGAGPRDLMRQYGVWVRRALPPCR